MSYIGAKPAEQILSSADIQDGAISTVDLADASITQAKLASGVAGTGPAFSAYIATSQTIGTGNVKIAFDTKVFDTNTNYNTTNYRFTPTVAGYYQFNTTTSGSTAFTIPCAQIWKNSGSGASSQIQGYQQYTGGLAYNATAAGIFYMNGSTDYVEVYLYSTSGGTVAGGTTTSVFTGCLLRSA